MKRTILFAGLALMLALAASAEEKRVPLKFQRQEKNQQNTKYERSPQRAPVDVYYDTETKVVAVIGYIETESEVLLLNETGVVEDQTDSINTTFTISSEGLHVIVINTPNWTCEGVIEP